MNLCFTFVVLKELNNYNFSMSNTVVCCIIYMLKRSSIIFQNMQLHYFIKFQKRELWLMKSLSEQSCTGFSQDRHQSSFILIECHSFLTTTWIANIIICVGPSNILMKRNKKHTNYIIQFSNRYQTN